MPNIFDLQITFLIVRTSSSLISISGIICDLRRPSMNDELIEMLSLMKAYLHILK